MKPTIGRIVHYYTTTAGKQAEGMGEGPYPAMVTRLHPHIAEYPSMVNLVVFMDFGATYFAGAVIEKQEAQAQSLPQWYEWPPRE